MDPEAEKGKDFAQQIQDRGQVTGGKQQKTNKTSFGADIQDLDSCFPPCRMDPLQQG